MTTRRTRLRRLVAATVAVALIAACGSDDDGNTDPPPPDDTPVTDPAPPDEDADADDEAPGEANGPTGTIRVGALADRGTFDPHQSEIGHQLQYLQPAYDTLLRLTADGEIVPMLATGWSYLDDDNTVLELTLRDDVRFIDGEVFDAEAVKVNIERGLSLPGPRAGALAAVDNVEVIDPTTVHLELSAPSPVLLLELTSVMAMMVSPAAFDNEDLDRRPVGSGPYVFDDAASSAGDLYVFTSNPDYWDPTLQGVERIELRVLGDQDARLNAIIAGQVDIGAGAPTQIAQAEGSGLEVLTGLVNWFGFVLADRDGSLVPALSEVDVRRAMNHAIDREAIVSAVALDQGFPTTQIFPATSAANTDDVNELYPYDPDLARALLADAGFADGFSFTVPTVAGLSTYAEAVAGYLAEVGIEMNIQIIDAGLIETWFSGEAPIPNVVFGGRHPYEMSNLFILESGTFNPFRTADPTVEELFAAAVAAGTEDEQMEAFAELNRYVTEQAWFMTTHFQDAIYFVGPNASGVEMYPSQVVPSIYGWRVNS